MMVRARYSHPSRVPALAGHTTTVECAKAHRMPVRGYTSAPEVFECGVKRWTGHSEVP